MTCGTCVVSNDCPSSQAEILENGLWGRQVPVGDEEALARGMGAALDESFPTDVARRAASISVEAAVAGYLRVLGAPT